MGDAWGKDKLHGHEAVTIKAMVRVCADLAREDAEPEAGPRRALGAAPRALGATWRKQFRDEGFYERFPAKGEVERVARVHRDLAKPPASTPARNS